MDEIATTEAVNVANEEIASKHWCQRQFWDRVRLLESKKFKQQIQKLSMLEPKKLKQQIQK